MSTQSAVKRSREMRTSPAGMSEGSVAVSWDWFKSVKEKGLNVAPHSAICHRTEAQNAVRDPDTVAAPTLNQLAPVPSQDAAVLGALPRYIAAGPMWYTVLSSLKPMVLPAGTETVSVAGDGVWLQVMSGEVTDVTGELFSGVRTAAVDVVLPAISVVQMSAQTMILVMDVSVTKRERTVSGDAVREEGDGSGETEELHGAEMRLVL